MNEIELVAYKCKKCGKIHYPFHDRCLNCRGREFDEVEADGWWGRQAVDARLSDPSGSLALLARRVLLLVNSRELGLDYPTWDH